MSKERLPLTLITGFLGSGKTTLLAELLRDPLLGDAVVLVNELGEVPLDHHLLREVDEKTVILDSGCVCCTIRTDLVDELRDLEVRVHRGELPAFRRVVVETTGLADPVPVLPNQNKFLFFCYCKHIAPRRKLPDVIIVDDSAVRKLNGILAHGEPWPVIEVFSVKCCPELRLVFDLHDYPLILGSRASRTPSPIRLKHTTVVRMAIPGKVEIHQ